ncbi:MAG: helix-turn-helix domain-containing protein [Clostridium sp.]|nr:helix-turn-helix domain-containing protein [Clostridium sp.]
MEKIIGLIIKKNRLEQNMSQESLCHGICAVSYLSKIENGSVKADMEIISKLFLELGITFSEVVSEEEEGEIYSALDNIFIEKLKFDRAKEILNKYSSMIYSTKVLTYLILEFIVKANEDFKSVDEKRFLAYENYADKKQLYYFYMVLGKFYLDFINDKEKALFYFEKAYMINPEGKGLFNIGVSYYIDGDYNRAIEYFNKDFILEIELGNIDDAVIDCIYLANTYSNLNSIPLMEKYYDKALKLSKNIDDNVKGNIYYNLGATYIKKDSRKSLKYLKMAEDIGYGIDCFYLYQKLVIVNLDLGNNEEAIKYLAKSKYAAHYEYLDNDTYIQHMIRMLEIICNDNNYLKNVEYGDVLSKLFYVKDGSMHYGFKLFFASYYVEWLKSNRKYKEALEVMEEIFSF